MLQQVATIPGYAAKHAEGMTFLVDKTFRQPIAAPHGGPHVMVPLAIKDGGRRGARAKALLRAVATSALAKDTIPDAQWRSTDSPHPIHVGVPLGLAMAASPFFLAAPSVDPPHHALALPCI